MSLRSYTCVSAVYFILCRCVTDVPRMFPMLPRYRLGKQGNIGNTGNTSCAIKRFSLGPVRVVSLQCTMHFSDTPCSSALFFKRENEERGSVYIVPATQSYISDRDRGAFIKIWMQRGINAYKKHIGLYQLDWGIPEGIHGPAILFVFSQNKNSVGHTQSCTAM